MEFIMYNNNPKNKRTDDCVIRAISLALNKTWADTFRSLAEFSIRQGLMINDTRNYKKYLNYLGLEAEKMPKHYDNTRYTIREFCDEIAKADKTYILSVAKHLTVVKNKKLYDTWDCSRKSVGNYWTINR